jgi:hypothetical protein
MHAGFGGNRRCAIGTARRPHSHLSTGTGRAHTREVCNLLLRPIQERARLFTDGRREFPLERCYMDEKRSRRDPVVVAVEMAGRLLAAMQFGE